MFLSSFEFWPFEKAQSIKHENAKGKEDEMPKEFVESGFS